MFLLSRVFIFFFKLFGWKVSGVMPLDKKYVFIIAPHTSNWDFFVAIAARFVLKMDTRWGAKNSIFKWPIKGLMKKLGGFPVDRTKRTNFVDSIIHEFEQHEHFAFTLAPEGTRKFVPEWKSGFYYIALGARVPIYMAGIDYKTKTLSLAGPFEPTGNKEEDFAFLKAHYKNIIAKYPEKTFLNQP